MQKSSVYPAAPDRAPGRSLAPDRDYATPPDRLGGALLGGAHESTLAAAFAQGMGTIARALAEHFPDNIYADVDFLAAALVGQARGLPDPDRQLALRCERVAALIALYGCRSAIRFRYAHDFLYGFDWARWARKDPAARAATGPFAPAFLDHLGRRGHELLALIERGDAQYPPLARGQWRNPFGFAREPAAEARLHRALAAEGLVPVAAWDIAARPCCDRDFHRLRRERAARLHG